MYPHNLIALLPNLANLPRTADLSFSGRDAGFKYSMMGGGGSTGMSNPSSVGFDVAVTNQSGVKATFALDGVERTILDGEIKWITNLPYDVFEITDTTGVTTANAIDVLLMGMDLSQIVQYTKASPNVALWS